MMRIVLDTNVLIAALISRRGASFRVLQLVGTGRFDIALSVPLVLEYESVAKRLSGSQIRLSPKSIDRLLDYLCSVASLATVHFLWRPFLKDPSDDMVLELAVNTQCDYVVTFNAKDFSGCERFGVRSVTPQEFLALLGGMP
jgi:putative PIN family toxin of toxin-antitoxin system